jgi:hypothetical protein
MGGYDLPQRWRKSCERGWKLWSSAPFIGGGERECGGRPARWRQQASSKPDRQSHGARQFPLLRVADEWPSVGVLNRAVSQNSIRHCSSTRPTKSIFLFSQNWTGFVNYENHQYVAPKFSILCNLIELKIRNNVPFGSKFKVETEIELKIWEIKLLLNLN